MSYRLTVVKPAAMLAALSIVLPTVAAAPAFAQDGKVTIPERTEVRLSLRQDLKSGASKEGSEVPFEVNRDVYGPNNQLLIRAGTPAYGKVVESKRRGIFGKSGKLNFTCDYIRLADGTRIPLRSESLRKAGKDNQGAAIATGLLLAPLGFFINGKDVEVKTGTEYTMYVDGNTTVPDPAKAVSAPASGGDNNGGTTAGAGKSVFLLNDGTVIVGALGSFDGTTYTIKTDEGEKSVKAADVKSITPIK